MAGLRLGGKHNDPKPERRHGIQLKDPANSATRLGGKLNPYVPPGAQYDYRPPSVFVRYKLLTGAFVVVLVAMFGYWAVVRVKSRAAAPAPQVRPAARPVAPSSDPVYIEPLPPK